MLRADLVRQPAGFVYIYEVTRLADRATLSSSLRANANKTGAKIKTTNINGFDTANEPVFLLRVEILKQGRPRLVGQPDAVPDTPARVAIPANKRPRTFTLPRGSQP